MDDQRTFSMLLHTFQHFGTRVTTEKLNRCYLQRRIVVGCDVSLIFTQIMAIKRNTGIIKKLNWTEVEATFFSTERDDADPRFEVCDASLDDWESFV